MFVRVQIKGRQVDIRLSTGLTVDAAAWRKAQTSAKAQQSYRRIENLMFSKIDAISKLIGTLEKEEVPLNSELLKQRIHEIVHSEEISTEKERREMEAKAEEERNRITFNDFVVRYIDECATGVRKKENSTKNVAPGTVKSYRGFFAQLKAYQECRNTCIDFADIDVEFYEDFMKFMLDKNYSPNTIARMVKTCKRMCYAAERMNLFDAKDIRVNVKAKSCKVDNIYLSEERVQELYSLDLSQHRAWERARDVFVVGCLTGQRVSDYKRINRDMIVRLSDGNEYIKLKQEKTGKTVYVPLDYRVADILAKYDGTLPKLFDQKLNDYIKKVGEMLGWTETVRIEEQRGSVVATVEHRFCDMIKTHTARRSFATNMYRAGASLGSIMAITGHGSEEQLRIYLKLTDEEKAIAARQDLSSRNCIKTSR